MLCHDFWQMYIFSSPSKKIEYRSAKSENLLKYLTISEQATREFILFYQKNHATGWYLSFLVFMDTTRKNRNLKCVASI